MANPRKIAIAVVSAAIWTSAVGSAGAVAYVLNRPLEPRLQSPPEMAQTSVGHLLGGAVADEAIVEALAAPVTPVHRVLFSKPPAAATVVDIEQMRCDDWRELQAGSGNVQVCEAPPQATIVPR